MAAAKKKVEAFLDEPKPKKYVTRYDAEEGTENVVLASIYIDKSAIEALGNPSRVKVTIEAA